jgi:hypothetical protein
VLGVVIVTMGIFITTFADARPVAASCGPNGCSAAPLTQWLSFDAELSPRKLVGITILLTGLFLSSLLGHLQSLGYELWKKRDENEAMFYQHFFSILFFAPFSGSLAERAASWSASEIVWTAGPLSLTWMWFNVAGERKAKKQKKKKKCLRLQGIWLLNIFVFVAFICLFQPAGQ